MIEKKTTQNTEKKKLSNHDSSDLSTIIVPLIPEKISRKAFEISLNRYSWDVLNWLIGENDLKLAEAIKEIPYHLSGPLPDHIMIDLSKINSTPRIEDIRMNAEQIAFLHTPLPQLYWDLAIQEVLFEEISLQ